MQTVRFFALLVAVMGTTYSDSTDLNTNSQSSLESIISTQSPSAAGSTISKIFENHNNGFKGEYGEMQLIIMNAQNDKVSRLMTQKIVEVNGEGDRSIIEFASPADVKGTRLLTHTMKIKKNKQWLYLPSIKRVKRINSRNQAISFMGSEFYYEDLASQETEKYQHTFLKVDTFLGRSRFILQRIPTDRHSGYSKLIVTLDKQYRAPVKIDYFDRKGELLKTAIFSNFQQHGKWWRQNKVTMSNHQTGKESIIVWKNLKLRKNYESATFSKRNLKN